MGATYSFFQLIGAPVLGDWSDRHGRKRILLLSQVGTFIAWILFIIALLIPNTLMAEVNSSIFGAFVLTVPLLILFSARALDGITGGNVSVANAYLADISTDDNRKSNFGKMSASANLGFIIGPAMAGLLGGTIFNELLPVLVAMIISLAAIFIIAFLMPESRTYSKPGVVDEQKIKKVLGQEHKECYTFKDSEKASLKEILRLEDIPVFLMLYFTIFLAFNFFYVAFPVHAVQYLEWSLFKLGIFFSILSFIMVIVQGPVLSKISHKFSDAVLTITGSLLLSGSFFLFTSSDESVIFGGVFLFSTGNGIMWPSFLSLLSKVAGQHYQGAVQGFASSAGSLASIIGLISGGVIYSSLGINIFIIPGVLLLIIFLMCFRLLKIEYPHTDNSNINPK
jgi:MFS family permease